MTLPVNFDEWSKESQEAYLRITKKGQKPKASRLEHFHHDAEHLGHVAARIAEFLFGLYLGLRGAINRKD